MAQHVFLIILRHSNGNLFDDNATGLHAFQIDCLLSFSILYARLDGINTTERFDSSKFNYNVISTMTNISVI